MATDKLDIDIVSILDNSAGKQVKFSGEVDAEKVQLAVQHDVLEALNGDAREDEAVEMFNRFADQIAEAGLVALARSANQTLIVISENDLQ